MYDEFVWQKSALKIHIVVHHIFYTINKAN